MKKMICSLIAIALILALNSCLFTRPTGLIRDEDGELIDECMQQVYIAIKENDSEALKAVFSEKAIDEAEDIDEEIERLLSFIQGKAVLCTRDESPVATEKAEDGCKQKQLVAWYDLNTDEEKYLIFVADYPIDTFTPENEGLYSLMILKAEDEDKLTGAIEDWIIPGIRILDQMS